MNTTVTKTNCNNKPREKKESDFQSCHIILLKIKSSFLLKNEICKKKKQTRQCDLYIERKIKFNQAIADHINTATPLKIVPKRNENIQPHKTYI